MSGKTTLVVLECPTLKTTREFEITHAERLLRMQNNGGWKLPEKSPFEFIENGIRRTGSKKEYKRAKEKSND